MSRVQYSVLLDSSGIAVELIQLADKGRVITAEKIKPEVPDARTLDKRLLMKLITQVSSASERLVPLHKTHFGPD